MKRRFNYTGRMRIPRERISIILNKNGDTIKSFTVDIDLTGLNLPSNAKVYVEAYHRTENKRFDFGTVENITSPINTSLAELAYTENLKFRVLVVDESLQHGLILAHADKIRPELATDKRSILPVEFRDIGHQIWRIDFSGEEGAPILIFNRHIPNIENIARSDARFFMFVYPVVIREVLTHMIFIDGIESVHDPSIEWHKEWLDFIKRILPDPPPDILDPRDDAFDEDAVNSWIDRVIEEFCATRKEWYEFLDRLEEEK